MSRINPKSGKGTGKQSKGAKGGRDSRRGEKPPYRGKSFGSGSKDDRRDEEIADSAAAMSRSNPVRFYDKYKELAHDSANLPFAQPLGASYVVSDGTLSDETTVPGVMALTFTPTIGISSDWTSPVNRSSINYYARLRSTQKAFGDYDHQDLTISMIAVDSCVMYHALGRKIYGILTDMTPLNDYYPRALCAACGVQFTSITKTIQDFRAYLNEFAVLVEQYAIPKGITLIERHQWMVEGLYTDGESSRAQTYMFVPRGFWKFNNTAEMGTNLVWIEYKSADITAQTITVEQFMAIGDQLINALSNDADIATMAGDLAAYYGTGERLTLPYVEEKYRILPKYDEVVLSQIENATIMGDWEAGYVPAITQSNNINEGAVLFKPYMDMGRTGTTPPIITLFVNMHKEAPTTDDIIEATRLMAHYGEEVTESGIRYPVDTCGSEIIHWVDIYAINPDTRGVRFNRVSHNNYDYQIEPSRILAVLQDVLNLQKFDWAPQIHLTTKNAAGSLQYLGSTWDIDNMIVLRPEYLKFMNTAMLFSEFDTPTH